MILRNSAILKPSTIGAALGAGFRAHPRYSGCIAHWVMSEGCGTTLTDISGTQSNGTLGASTAAPTWSRAGQFGPVLSFDGGDEVNIGDKADPTFISISAWIKSTQAAGAGDIVTKDDLGGSGTRAYRFYIQTVFAFDVWKTGGVGTVQGTDWQEINSAVTVNTGKWVHLVGTWDGITIRSYINGKPGASIAFAGTLRNVATNLYLGRSAHSSSGRYTGLMDEVRIYNRPITRSEVLSLYQYPYLEFASSTQMWRGLSSVVAAVGGIMPPPYLQAVKRAGYF